MQRNINTISKVDAINSPYINIEIDGGISTKNLSIIKKLFDVLSSTQASAYEKDFYEPLYEISHPLSSFQHLTIKESDNHNPYTLVASHPVFIKLLSLFQYGIDMHPIGNHGTIYLSSHTRGLHSLDVAFNYEMIARGLDLSEKEIILGIIAGLLHDVATPAFGDITMKAMPELKEEQNFVEYMKKYPDLCDTIYKQYNITIEEIGDIVHSKHPLYTHILDVADKFAYTARDVDAVFPHELRIPQIFPKADKYAHIIYTILNQDEKVFDILLDVTLSKDKTQIVFGDSKKLLNILFLRAYMHNMIYLNHNVWGKEFLIGIVLRYLVEKNNITKEELQHKKISRDILDTYSHHNTIPNYDLVDTSHLYSLKKVDSLEKVQYIIDTLGNEIIPLIIKVPRFKVGDNFLVKGEDGREIPLSEKYPQETESLRKVGLQTECFIVLSLSREELEKYTDFDKFIQKESDKNISSILGTNI